MIKMYALEFMFGYKVFCDTKYIFILILREIHTLVNLTIILTIITFDLHPNCNNQYNRSNIRISFLAGNIHNIF